MKGHVSKWDAEKKFGFVVPDDPAFSPAFLHQNELPRDFNCRVGLRLEFDIGAPNDVSKKIKGGRAINVRVDHG